MSKIKRNFIYNLILSISQVLYPLVTFPYVARILNPDGIGLNSFVDSICKYFMLFAALGIPIYGIREVAKVKNSRENINKLFSELFLIHILVTFIVSMIFFIFIFNTPKLEKYKLFFSIGSMYMFSKIFIV